MTLLAFAAVRRAEAPLLQSAGACYRPMSPARRVLSSKPAARRPVVVRLERQTDGRMDARPFRRPCSAVCGHMLTWTNAHRTNAHTTK